MIASTYIIHAPPARATIVQNDARALVLHCGLADYSGPAVWFNTGDAALAGKLAEAINAVLDDHRASAERPVISEAAE